MLDCWLFGVWCCFAFWCCGLVLFFVFVYIYGCLVLCVLRLFCSVIAVGCVCDDFVYLFMVRLVYCLLVTLVMVALLVEWVCFTAVCLFCVLGLVWWFR